MLLLVMFVIQIGIIILPKLYFLIIFVRLRMYLGIASSCESVLLIATFFRSDDF
jgi:hypothetical protein